MLINAEGDGVVDYVDASKIIIRYDRSEEDQLVSFEDNVKTYPLTKFLRTNQGTCINLNLLLRKVCGWQELFFVRDMPQKMGN
jgi:DNA-directed RNA polymerase subunit beta